MKNLLFLLLIFCAFACSSPKDDGLSAFNEETLGKNISTLSSDIFMGRMPFTMGEVRTLNFLEDEFKKLGLEPGNDTSFFQDVPLVNISAQADAGMQVHTKKEDFSFTGNEDYVIWTDKTEASQSLKKSDVVFAGYGIVAPEYDWNDYAGLDVRGKVVLVLVNDPGYRAKDSTLFKGKTMTYYGRWTYKYEEAARQGAKACLVIHNTEAASYPFSVVQNSWNHPKLKLDLKNSKEPLCDAVGWISEPAMHRLLAATGKDSTFLSQADSAGFKAQRLNATFSTNIQVEAEYKNSKNVIAKITGSKKPDEYIIYTAHWDHLGIGSADDNGDSIYNGAFDNATGTAGLIELARAFKQMKPAPERTIVFMAVTAEEQGLLGSQYYSQNPICDPTKTLANINMDGLNYLGATSDIILVGKNQNNLEDYLKKVLESTGRELAFEDHPEAGYYYRSDHFNFAKIGIPALYTRAGIKVIGQKDNYGKQMGEFYRKNHYHRPSDEYDPALWKLDGATEDLKALFVVGKAISSSNEWPAWKDGSEFKGIREKSLETNQK
ncbi:MAG: M28 family metallopeptidase [Cytophagales bacterium]|nr:M28 family metallopeptidase [Cytophagales bacterium]